MIIYWIFLLLSLIVWYWNGTNYELVTINGQQEKRARWIQAIIFFGVVIFFCGLRSGIADTGTYIHMFKNYYPNSVSAIEWNDDIKDKGFYLLTTMYKQFVSSDWQGWLFLIALISGVCTMRAFKKYSVDFGFSCFLFIATTIFTYLVNGMRQYICVAIVFACIDLVLERKLIKFLMLILLLSTIHVSVIIFIPVYFIMNIKPWSIQMFIVILIALVFGLFFEQLFPMFSGLLEETQYEGYISYIETQGVGSNVIRLAIAAIPCVLAFLGRQTVREEGNSLVNVCVNMSVINLCLYFVATFSSGMVMGRMTIYFDIFNLLLLPWLLKHVFTSKSRRIITLLCVFFYTIYFYYQMVLTWNIGYESSLLRLYL